MMMMMMMTMMMMTTAIGNDDAGLSNWTASMGTLRT